MKKGLLFYNLKPRSDAWHKFRTVGLTEEEVRKIDPRLPPYEVGIGASEGGVLLGLTYQYETMAKKFFVKVGTDTYPQNNDNESMFWGRKDEKDIIDVWRCYGPNGYLENYAKYEKVLDEDVSQYFTPDILSNVSDPSQWAKAYSKWQTSKRKELRKNALVRDGRTYNGCIVNPKYPFLFCTLDYYANPGSADIFNGRVFEHGFPVECKTLSSLYAMKLGINRGGDIKIAGVLYNDTLNKGNYRIPLSYIVQIHIQMLITETDYAEIPVRIGGNKFELNRYYRNEELCRLIVEESEYFCRKVLAARKLKELADNAYEQKDKETHDEAMEKINAVAPGGGNEDLYAEYRSDNFIEEVEKVKATDEVKNMAKEDALLQKMEKAIAQERTIRQNVMVKLAADNGAELIDMGELGNVSYKFAKSNSKSRSIRNNLRAEFKPSDEFIDRIIKALPVKYYK